MVNSPKPQKQSAALVIYEKNGDKFLIVKRPDNADSLPGFWGFPAATKTDNSESWESVVQKAAKTKLGVKVKIIKYLGEEKIDRGNYFLTLKDYEVEVTESEISVPQNEQGTQYVDTMWTNDTSELIKSAKNGSLCSRVFLKSRGINWK